MSQSKKIEIIDADLLDGGTKHPNLALMKISGYNKQIGNSVELIKTYNGLQSSHYDQIYISRVFTFTNVNDNVLKFKNVIIGGTGFFLDGGKNLPSKIEHHMPDYHLYDDYIKECIENGKSESHFADYLN